jgi:hypothetical protein
VHVLDVEVQHVELVRVAAHALDHQQVVGHGVGHLGIEAQRGWGAGDEARRGLRIGAREQGHVAPQPYQLLGKVRNDPLGTPVQPRRHALREGCYLCDLHI